MRSSSPEEPSGAARLLVIGDANPDLVLRTNLAALRPSEQEVLVPDWALTLGGSASIFACAAAHLGISTAFAGVVGDDAAGRFVLDWLGAAGVDLSMCRVDPGGRTAVTVVLSGTNDRSILTGTATAASLDAADALSAAQDASHVHIGGFFVAPILAGGLPELLAAARADGATTSLDTNWDPLGSWRGIEPLAGALDYLLLNEQEAMQLAGEGEGDVTRAASRLAPIAETVVVKRGGRGALGFVAGRNPVAVDAFPVDVVDTTGAGDNFDAGFVCGRLKGLGLEDSVRLACACGALSTRALGGVGAHVSFEQALALARGGG